MPAFISDFDKTGNISLVSLSRALTILVNISNIGLIDFFQLFYISVCVRVHVHCAFVVYAHVWVCSTVQAW